MRYFLNLAIILLFNATLFAHDGTTINYRVFFKFDGFYLTDIGQSWTFDETTSEGLMEMYKLKNIKLEKAKSIKIGTKIMNGVASYHYFTYIFVNGKDLGKIDASKFKAQVSNSIVSVAFNSHLSKPIDTRKSILSLIIEDKTQGMEMKLVDKNPVVLIPKQECKINIKDKISANNLSAMQNYSMGIAIPKKITLDCKSR